VQHALRAFTPKDQKAVRAAAETFRARPGLDVATAIMELETGEALVSVLDAKGAPTMVERALIAPPRSRLQPLDPNERVAVINGSPLAGHYEKEIDRESAYEKLKSRTAQAAAQQPPEAARGRSAKDDNPDGEIFEAAAKSAARAIGSQVGRQIIRGILGSLFGGGGQRR
jgi:hypothetical protein